MITLPDPTPEQRKKILRSYRFTAVSYSIYGLVLAGLAILELARGHRTLYASLNCVIAVGFLVMSGVSWNRVRRYM